jgi:hypothetical protein
LVYLANEVAQQSRARRKDEFPKAFGGIIAEAMAIAYRGSTVDIQNKLRRVVDVWRTRNVFEPHILADVDKRLDGNFPFYIYLGENYQTDVIPEIGEGKGKGGIKRPVRAVTGPAIPPELVSYPPRARKS